MMDYCMKTTIMFSLLSLATASPPSQQDFGFCSQIYTIHQYCTSQISPTSTGVTHRPAVQPRVGKAGPVGPRGPPAIVNYTAYGEKIAAKYLDLESRIDEKIEQFKSMVNEQLERSNLEIEEIRNETGKGINGNRKVIDRLMPSSCDEVATNWKGNEGVVEIYRSGTRYEVYCDMVTDGGRWTVFQRRMDGTVDFYRDWEDYARGFGNKSGEFWLGLESVHQLTQDDAYELRVYLTDWDGSTAYAKYGTFSISGRSDNYRLTVGGYSGTAGDSLAHSNNWPFSAKNRELDPHGSLNCAIFIQTAWWFNAWFNVWFGACSHSSLNGRYNDTSGIDRGLYWQHWKKRNPYSLKASEMKFRKK